MHSLEGHTDCALSELQGKDDPVAIDRRLAILLDSERYEEAAATLKDKCLDTKFCVNATAVYVKANHLDDAKAVISWAKENCDLLTWHRCILKIAALTFEGLAGYDQQQLPNNLPPASKINAPD